MGYNSQTVEKFQKRSAYDKARFLIPYLKKDHVLLDCGCGPGSIKLDFASILSQGRVVRIDMESSQIKKARNSAINRGIQNVEFHATNLLNLPFQDATFDIAFTHAVLWSVSDIRGALRELKRVVKPGGIVACREPNANDLCYYPTSKILDKAFELQYRSHKEFACDNNLGKKLPSYFSEAQFNNIQTTHSSDVYSSKEERMELVQVTLNAWKEAPWSNKIREKKWAREDEIQKFLDALSNWEKQPNAFLSTAWSEVIGYVP